MFKERKQHKADEAARVQAANEAAAAQERSRWALLAYRYALLDDGVPAEQLRGVTLRPGEMARIAVSQAVLFEPRRPPAQWVSHGVSVRVMKGVYLRSNVGRVIPREDQIVAIDTGVFVVTDSRCVFVGPKRTTEWQFAKLLGYSLDGVPGTAIFNVSNRQKASGVAYGVEWEVAIESVIAAAIARFRGPEYYNALLEPLYQNAVAALAAVGEAFPSELQSPTRPPPPPPPSPPPPPPPPPSPSPPPPSPPSPPSPPPPPPPLS